MSVTILIVLYVLAVVDSACAGYRVAAGRNALIRKRGYYRRAMLRGVLLGHGAVAIALALIALLLVYGSPGRNADLEKAGAAMLKVYLPYAAVIALAFAFRIFPSVDIRCLTSTLIFGPFVLIRPLVAVAGGCLAVASAPRPEVVGLVGVILLMMLALEPIMNTLHEMGRR